MSQKSIRWSYEIYVTDGLRRINEVCYLFVYFNVIHYYQSTMMLVQVSEASYNCFIIVYSWNLLNLPKPHINPQFSYENASRVPRIGLQSKIPTSSTSGIEVISIAGRRSKAWVNCAEGRAYCSSQLWLTTLRSKLHVSHNWNQLKLPVAVA